MEEEGSKTDELPQLSLQNKKKKNDSLRKEAIKYREDLDKRGVIYLSRIPPFMKPNKVRNIFEQYGEVTRLYLCEEDLTQRKKRKEKGGNGSKQFKEGWIEFSDKSLARSIADSLNNTCIGGKKGSFYHDDIWNIKYLKSFKWDYLTEKLAYERRVMENKLNLALMQSKKANAEIVELMEKSKVQKIIEQRKRKGSDNNNETNVDEPRNKRMKQVKLMAHHPSEIGVSQLNKSLLKSVFTDRQN